MTERTRGDSRRGGVPIVIGEDMNPPRYGDNWNEEASRKFFAACHAYSKRVYAANTEGSRQHTKLLMTQRIPPHM